jgi:hypothetical protein
MHDVDPAHHQRFERGMLEGLSDEMEENEMSGLQHLEGMDQNELMNYIEHMEGDFEEEDYID